VSPLFPAQFPKFEYIAATHIKAFFEILKFIKVSPTGGNYSRLFVFNGVHEDLAV
jgi:hypothetical protein